MKYNLVGNISKYKIQCNYSYQAHRVSCLVWWYYFHDYIIFIILLISIVLYLHFPFLYFLWYVEWVAPFLRIGDFYNIGNFNGSANQTGRVPTKSAERLWEVCLETYMLTLYSDHSSQRDIYQRLTAHLVHYSMMIGAQYDGVSHMSAHDAVT